jgi:hypothetical protein
MKTLQLKVTQDIIDHAIKKDSRCCAIANAVKDKYPTAKSIKVDVQSVKFTLRESGMRYTFLTPPLGQKLILDFDNGKAIHPCKLNLLNGIERPASWAGNHPNSSKKVINKRKRNAYKKTGQKRVFAKREREYGIRMFAESK